MSVVTSTEKGLESSISLKSAERGWRLKQTKTKQNKYFFRIKLLFSLKNRCMYSDEFLQLGLNYILMITFTKATNFSSEIVGGQLCTVWGTPAVADKQSPWGHTAQLGVRDERVWAHSLQTQRQPSAAKRSEKQKNVRSRQFPLSPVVKTRLFPRWGPGSVSAPGTKMLQAVRERRMKGVHNLNYA